jgi:hypothetical protein
MNRRIRLQRLVQALLQQKWQLTLSLTRLYEIFDELHLSRQRAHRDYGPRVPASGRGSRKPSKKPRHPARHRHIDRLPRSGWS